MSSGLYTSSAPRIGLASYDLNTTGTSSIFYQLGAPYLASTAQQRQIRDNQLNVRIFFPVHSMDPGYQIPDSPQLKNVSLKRAKIFLNRKYIPFQTKTKDYK